MKSPDILIIGAGPVGLTLAAACHRFGLDFRIIDKAPSHSVYSKALAVWSGTIEGLATLGLAERFLAAGRPIRRAVIHDAGVHLAEIPLNQDLDTPYPAPFILPQSRTEEILIDHLAGQGVEVERGVECVDLRPGDSAVTCDLLLEDGSRETVVASWVAACDGARSLARHKLPVEFPGVTETEAFILMDAKVRGDLPDDAIVVSFAPQSNVIIFPVKPGVWRIFAFRPDLADESQPTLEEIQQRVDDAGLSHLRFYDPEWLSRFAVNERVVSRNRVDRVFLLGDAAHIHSPAGGQGMNTGMQDAFNLAWKLKLLTEGCGHAETIAESYHAERHPVAEAVVRETSRVLHLGTITNPAARLFKKIALPILSRLGPVTALISRLLSEIGISYPAGPLVFPDSTILEPAAGFAPGARARDVALRRVGAAAPSSLWREFLHPGHTLVLFSGPNPPVRRIEELASVARETREIHPQARRIVLWHADAAPVADFAEIFLDPEGEGHRRYGLAEPGWYIIRPDQYVAARGSNAEWDRLEAYWRLVS